MLIDKTQFASDNYAGICPEAMQATIEANAGFDTAYGEDRWTQEACDRFREVFGTDCEVFFVFGLFTAQTEEITWECGVDVLCLGGSKMAWRSGRR